MEELSNETKILLLEGHFEQYQHQEYIAGIDAEIARATGDDQMLKAAQNIIKRAKVGMDTIRKELEKLRPKES